jgi:hypothetical protein
MDLARIGQKQFRLTLTWGEARILTQAMMTTLGGDISYPEYKVRIGAEVEEVTRMILAIQNASRGRRHPKGQFASSAPTS